MEEPAHGILESTRCVYLLTRAGRAQDHVAGPLLHSLVLFVKYRAHLMCLIPRLTGILLDCWGARSVELVPGPTMGSRSDDLVVTWIAS